MAGSGVIGKEHLKIGLIDYIRRESLLESLSARDLCSAEDLFELIIFINKDLKRAGIPPNEYYESVRAECSKTRVQLSQAYGPYLFGLGT